MKFAKGLVLSAILMILVSVGSASASTNNSEPQEYTYGPYPAVSNDLLREYEPDYENFRGVEIADKIVYFQQRTIGEAIVQKDYILYHFDRHTRELLDVKINWRDDLPEELPKIISREQAESMVDGEVQFSRLFYISPESYVFPIDPPPENPCWVIETFNEDRITVTVIDAVEGKIAGYGVPPPYTAFSLSGPISFEPCSESWGRWYENARDWFNTMGYTTEAVKWPTEDKVKSHIQSHTTAMFYELAHGGSTIFTNGCDDSTIASEIETWIADYYKMPFAFIGSCDGMCGTGDGTLSYELRKGSDEDTTTVGYCGMSSSPCVGDCWYAGYTVDWQTTLFNYMNQGWTVKAAFDQANAAYPGCGANGCMRFAGDETFTVVPVVNRKEILTACCPAPADGAGEVSVNVILQWTAGAHAASHDVYFGTDFDDVNDANNYWPVGISAYKGNKPLDANSYDPCGLEFDTTYYWRIDEVNDVNLDSPWKGEVWTFKVANFLIVDNMEDYNDIKPDRILDTWHDWSQYDPVGGKYPTAAELTLETADANVHSGRKSMKFQYNNSDDGAWYFYRNISEIDANTVGPQMYLEIGQDWTILDMEILTLHFIGRPDNDADEQMYVALADSAGRTAVVPYGYYDDEDTNDIKKREWQEWNILLENFNDINDVNVADVNNVYIGFGNRDNPTVGGSGIVFFDDIRLHPRKCIASRRKPDLDLSNNCIVDFEDFAILGNQWLQPPGSPSADICPEPPDGFVDMLDLDCLTEGWLEQKLWPPEE